MKSVNWFAFAAGMVTLIVLGISLYIPWWQLTVGDSMMKVNASPVNTNFGMLGVQFTIPLIWALNVSSVLTFSLSGLLMLVYAIFPDRSYSEHLLSFCYKKPLFSIVTFVSGLLIITSIAGLLRVDIPLFGASSMSLPADLTFGANITAYVAGNFLLPFWLAIVAATLCIGARLYHSRVAKNLESPSPPPPPPPPQPTAKRWYTT